MNGFRWPWARPLLAAMLASMVILIAPSARAMAPGVDATASAAGAGSISMLAQHGFGDRQNSYAWAMKWFKGKLYVGTGRDVLCVENATNQFYFQFSTFYRPNPAPGVSCPRNEYDLDLRAEIWQYTPRTQTWRMVYRAPADIPNPRARGKHVARDIAYRGMVVMPDSQGRQALFISGVTADEYLPELARSHPPRLLRTYDGTHFDDIAVPLIARRCCGFVDHRVIGFRGLQVWNKRLYVLGSVALTGDGSVFEVRHPFASKAQFVQVTPRTMHVFEMDQFDGHLFVGTGSFTDGYGVYKTPSTSMPRRAPYPFTPVVTNGAGMGTQMVSVVSMHPFRGHLYVGAVSWYSTSRQGLPAAELIRIGHDDQWEVVTGDPRRGPDGRWRYPISGLPAGFGNSFNSHLWRIADEGGALFVGTLDWSWLLQDTKQWAGQYVGLVNGVLQPEFGFDLWKSCDGVSWSPVTRNAFGVDPDDFGVRTLEPTNNGFVLGTANHAHGTRIWQGRGLSSCGSTSVHGVRAVTAQAPRSLLTDVQPGGTLLSWERSLGAARFRIERAAYVQVPVSIEPPATLPASFPSEDGLPEVVAPDTPGSVSIQVPVLGPFEALGTSTQADFVDRTRKQGVRYVYRVVAETASGRMSAPSNLQVVPDPRPPATFAQLDQAASGSSALAAIARARSAGNAALQPLGWLARTATQDQVRELAYRLGRRLRYENLAAPVRGGR